MDILYTIKRGVAEDILDHPVITLKASEVTPPSICLEIPMLISNCCFEENICDNG
jgi:hypothetical protein